MQIDWFTFIAQIVNFLILIWLLHRFLYKPVIKAMDEREQKIASELEDARLRRVEAEQREHEFEQKVKDLEFAKEQMLEEARQKAEAQKNEMMNDIRQEINRIKKRWEDAVESEKEAFLVQLQYEVGEQIVSLLNKVLKDLSDRDLQEQTVNIFWERLKKLSEEDKVGVQNAVEELQLGEAEILSAFELSGQQKRQTVNLIRDISGAELKCLFEVTDELGFGLEVRIGGWSIGWNMKRYLDSLHQNMRDFFLNQSVAGKISELR